MADPFTIAVSTAGLVSLGIQLLQGLNQYAGSALDSKGRIKAISTDIDLTIQIVKALDTTIQDDANKAMMTNDAARLAIETIAQCRDVFAKIQSTLPEYSATGPRRRDVITWPFIEPKLDILRGNLEKLKTSLQLLMSVIIFAAMSKRHSEQPILDQQRLQIDKLLEEKAAAETRLEALEHDYAQALAAVPPDSSSTNQVRMPPAIHQPESVGLARVEQFPNSHHIVTGQFLGTEQEINLPGDDPLNESSVTNLYDDYTTCLRQIKVLQTSLETALNKMFEPDIEFVAFPIVSFTLTGNDRQMLVRAVHETTRETLECLNQRILRTSANNEIMRQHRSPQLDRPPTSHSSSSYHQNGPLPHHQIERSQAEGQQSNRDEYILDPSDPSFMTDPDCTPTSFGRPSVSSATRRGRKQSLSEDPSKTFACTLCSRRFRRQEHLARHHRSSHVQDKPYECASCGKKFSRSDNLSQHQRSHSGSVVLSDIPQQDLQTPATAQSPTVPISDRKNARSSLPPLDSVDDLLDKWTHLNSEANAGKRRWVEQEDDGRAVRRTKIN